MVLDADAGKDDDLGRALARFSASRRIEPRERQDLRHSNRFRVLTTPLSMWPYER